MAAAALLLAQPAPSPWASTIKGTSSGTTISIIATAQKAFYSATAFTTIDDPLGVGGTFALGINNKDEVVGFYYDSLHRQNGFLFSNGNYTTLDDPLGINGTYATGISDASVIVGYYLSNGFNSDGEFLASIGHGFLASTSAVPEPSTWAMMLIGFAGLGFAFRQSRRKVSVA